MQSPMCSIDRSNPLSQGILRLYDSRSGADLALLEGVTRGSAYATGSTPGGAALLGAVNSYALMRAISPRYSDDLTLFAYVCGKESPTSSTSGITWAGVGNSFVSGCTSIGQDSYGGGVAVGSVIYYYPDYSGTLTGPIAPSIISPAKLMTLVGVYRRNDYLRLYVNGVEAGSSATANYAANLGYGSNLPSVLSTRLGSVDVLLSGIAARAWTPFEVASFDFNPLQLVAA